MKIFLVDPCLHNGPDAGKDMPLHLTTRDEIGMINVFPMSSKPPLAFLYFVPILEKAGFEVTTLELTKFVESSDVPPYSLYTRWEEFVTGVSPAVFAFTTNARNYPTVINLSRVCKYVSTSNIVIHGGPQATVVAESAMSHFPWIDYVVLGEGEDVFVRLMTAIRESLSPHSVPGIVFSQFGSPVRTTPRTTHTDLESLPPPVFGLFPLERYVEDHGRLHAILETSRGCPHACYFCTASGTPYREKSIGSVIREVRSISAWFPPRMQVTFVSNLLFAADQRIAQFCAGIHEADLEFTWGCFARVDRSSPTTLHRMRDAGCRVIHYGLESGSPAMQRVINKYLDIEQSIDVVRETIDAGICPTVSFVIGFPEETPTTLRETKDVILRLRDMGALIYPTVMTPHRGTVYFERYSDQLVLNPYRKLELLHDDDELLVRQFPEIFSYFYYVQPENLSIAQIESAYFEILDEMSDPDRTHIWGE